MPSSNSPGPAAPFRSAAGPLQLLLPKIQMARNFVRRQDWKGILLFLFIAAVVLASIYGLSWKLLTKIDSVSIIGPLLKRYLLSMILFSLLTMLVFSNVIASLSTFYGSQELEPIFASPTSYWRVFLAKFAETTFISSWMVVGMLTTLLLAYGRTYQAPFYFYLLFWVPLVPFCMFAASAGAAISLVLAKVLPVHQTRNILRFLGAVAIGLLVLFVRMLRPEQLMRPEKFESFAKFMYSLHNPRLEAFPSAWAANTLLQGMGLDVSTFARDSLKLFGGAALAFAATYLLARAVHLDGWLKFQESGERGRKGGSGAPGLLDRLLVRFSVPVRAILEKDLKVFVRSPVLWTQFLLMLVIVAIYVYNVYLLPLGEMTYVHPVMPDLLSFLNIGFVAFIVIACALRFGYPAVSMEGSVFYRIHASPMSLRTYLWVKFWTNFVPLLTISMFLVIVSNLLLGVRPIVFAVSLLDGVLVALAVSTMALFFGSYYRNFKAENFAQIPSGFGGMVFMVSALAYVTVLLGLQFYPLWVYYASSAELGLSGWQQPPAFHIAASSLCALLSIGLSLFLWLYPLRVSERMLTYLEETGA